MSNINEFMNKNNDPKWMTENENGNQGEKQGKKEKGGGGGGDDNNQQQNNKPKAPAAPKQDYKVKMCCSKCEEKVLEEARYVLGVQSVSIDRGQSKVTVVGNVDPTILLKKFKNNVNKKACFWPLETKKESGGGGGGGKGGKAEKAGDHGSPNGQKQGKGGDGNKYNNSNNNGGGGEKKKGGGGGGGGGNTQQNNGEGHGGDNTPKNKSKDNNNGGGHGGGGGGGGDNASKNKNQNSNEGGGQGSGHGDGEGKGKGKAKGGGGGGGSGGGNNNQNSSNSYREMDYPPMAFRDQSYGFQPMDPRGVDPRLGYGGGGYYPDYRSHPADMQYQPKANYYSDYRPSQSYPADFRSLEYSGQPITNPNYMKSIIY